MVSDDPVVFERVVVNTLEGGLTVKKLFQRVRDWLIKKLGGFTWEEYNRLRPRIIKIDERNLEPVRVEVA